MEKSDHRDRRLLRARRPRHRRAAEQRDELATLQSIELHLLPQPGTSWAAYRIGHDQVRGLPQCRISTRPMSESGLGCVKTVSIALRTRVRLSPDFRHVRQL